MKSILQPSDTLLFDGDSITNAHRMAGEINLSFQLGAGYTFLIAARLLLERPGDNLKFFNRGMSGEALPNLAARWDTDCLAIKPDVLSLLIGTNDAGLSTSPEQFEANYRALLERTRAALPDIHFVLCEPFRLPVEGFAPPGAELVRAYQPLVPNIARDFDATFVPFQKMFDDATQIAPSKYWVYDSIHPDAAGFALMARQWLSIVCGI